MCKVFTGYIIFYAEHIFVAKQEFLGKEKEPYVGSLIYYLAISSR